MSGHPAAPRQPAPHAPRLDPAAAPILDAAFEGGWSQNPVTWILGPIAENPFPDWQLSLSENRANPIEYYFYRARYYEPGVGRFTQRDQLEAIDGNNRYVYVDNMPLMFVDPYGFKKSPIAKVCCQHSPVDLGPPLGVQTFSGIGICWNRNVIEPIKSCVERHEGEHIYDLNMKCCGFCKDKPQGWDDFSACLGPGEGHQFECRGYEVEFNCLRKNMGGYTGVMGQIRDRMNEIIGIANDEHHCAWAKGLKI